MRDNNASIFSVISQFDPNTPYNAWVIRPLQHGKQAKAFLAYNPNRKFDTTQSSHFVIKIFDKKKPNVTYALNNEYESLSLMSFSFRKLQVDGWKISVPSVSFLSHDPPALVMNYIQGIPLDDLLRRTDEKTRNILSTLYKPISLAFQKYWSDHSRIIGDLNYNNLLLDISTDTLIIVDPGVPDPSFIWNDTPNEFFPASNDLGYLLFEVCATNTKIRILSRDRAQRRSSFVQQLIRCYMHKFIEKSHYDNFLEELQECSNRHVTRIKLSWGVRGFWRRYVATKTLSSLSMEIGEILSQLSMTARGGDDNEK